MKVGEEVNCPHCSQDVFLVKQVVIDGWTKVGEILVCSMCSKKIFDIKKKKEQTEKDNKDSSINKLAVFLEIEKEIKPELEEEEKYFCRGCIHFIVHLFWDRCSYFNKSINPMDECSNFILRDGKSTNLNEFKKCKTSLINTKTMKN